MDGGKTELDVYVISLIMLTWQTFAYCVGISTTANLLYRSCFISNAYLDDLRSTTFIMKYTYFLLCWLIFRRWEQNEDFRLGSYSRLERGLVSLGPWNATSVVFFCKLYAVMDSMGTTPSLEEHHLMIIPPSRLSKVTGVPLKKMGIRSMKKFS